MNWNNEKKDHQQEIKEELLQWVESFLEYVENIFWEKLSDATKMKNLNHYSLLLQWNAEQDFAQRLSKYFEVVKRAQQWFIEDSLKEKKSQIKSAELFILPRFIEGNSKLESVFFVRKKDQFWDFKKKINNWIQDILGNPELQH